MQEIVLVVKMTISMSVNRKFVRMKPMIRVENSGTFKRIFFSHLNVQAPTSGVCNTIAQVGNPEVAVGNKKEECFQTTCLSSEKC